MFKDGDCSLFRRENNDRQFSTSTFIFLHAQSYNNLGDSRKNCLSLAQDVKKRLCSFHSHNYRLSLHKDLETKHKKKFCFSSQILPENTTTVDPRLVQTLRVDHLDAQRALDVLAAFLRELVVGVLI